MEFHQIPPMACRGPSFSLLLQRPKHRMLLKNLIFESRLSRINHMPKRGLKRFRGITLLLYNKSLFGLDSDPGHLEIGSRTIPPN